MGKKRKQEQSADEIKKKIKKLEEELKKKRRLRPRVIQSSSEDETDDNVMTVEVEQHPAPRTTRRPAVQRDPSLYHDTLQLRSPTPRQASPESQQGISPPRAKSPEPELQTQDIPATLTEAEAVPPEEINLEDDILQILGDAPKQETALGKAIHKDVASRWQEVLSKGLKKDVKDKILQEYLVPMNCDLLVAPNLNPEVKAALPEALVKRDSSLKYKQNQLGIALAALANVTELIISNETSKQKILKPLSDACRILCDSHHTETKTRRHFVISSINTNMKDTLIDTTRDKFLFGDNVSDKLKAAKSIQRSGDTLKNVNKTVFTKSNFAYRANTNKNNLNFKPQHRKTDNKAASNNSRSRQTAHAPPPPRNNARKTSDRSRSPVRKNLRRY